MLGSKGFSQWHVSDATSDLVLLLCLALKCVQIQRWQIKVLRLGRWLHEMQFLHNTKIKHSVADFNGSIVHTPACAQLS